MDILMKTRANGHFYLQRFEINKNYKRKSMLVFHTPLMEFHC